MDADKRHEAPGSETKGFISQSSKSSQNAVGGVMENSELRGSESFLTNGQKACLPLALEAETVSVIQGCLLYTYP